MGLINALVSDLFFIYVTSRFTFQNVNLFLLAAVLYNEWRIQHCRHCGIELCTFQWREQERSGRQRHVSERGIIPGLLNIMKKLSKTLASVVRFREFNLGPPEFELGLLLDHTWSSVLVLRISVTRLLLLKRSCCHFKQSWFIIQIQEIRVRYQGWGV
jgi:hypothetical protein